jgi:hypothetical protein
MNYLDDNTLNAMKASMNKEAFVPMPGGMPEDPAAAGGAPPAGGPPMGGDPSMGGAPPPQDPAMMGGGGAPMPLPPEVIPILQQMGITVDPQTGMAIDPESGQPIPTEMVMQVLQENGMLGGAPMGGDPSMGGAPMGDPSMGGAPMGDPAAGMPPEAAPQEPLLPPDSVAAASKEEFKAIMADVLKRDLPGILKQELPSIVEPIIKDAIAQICSGQAPAVDESILAAISEGVTNNNDILNTITGVLPQ